MQSTLTFLLEKRKVSKRKPVGSIYAKYSYFSFGKKKSKQKKTSKASFMQGAKNVEKNCIYLPQKPILSIMKKYFFKLRAQNLQFLGRLTLFRIGQSRNVCWTKRIYYAKKDGLYYNICQPLDINQKLPVFVYLHGGGWVSGRPECRLSFCSNIAALGFFTINIFYGYAPKFGHPYAVENIYNALSHLIKNKDRYSIDLTSIFVFGESAGAHLSAILGCICSNNDYKNMFNLPSPAKDLTFKGLILCCGIYDLYSAAQTDFKHIKDYVEAYCNHSIKLCPPSKIMSPIHFVGKDFPNTLIISAKNDKLCAQSFMLKLALSKKEASCTHLHATGRQAIHGYPVLQYLNLTKKTMNQIEEFLLHQFKSDV